MPLQRRTDGSEVVGVFVELLVEMLPGLPVVDVHGDLHPAILGAVMVAPDTACVLFLKGEGVLPQHLLVLVRGVHIKKEDAALFHKEPGVGNGRVEVRDMVEGIEGGHSTPDGAVEVELEQVLLQQQQPARKAQLFGFVPHDAEHLLRLVDADHIIARLGQHQGQLTRAAAQVCQDAIRDAVGGQFLVDMGIEGIVVGFSVEFIVEVGKFIVSHGVTPHPLRRRPRSERPAAPGCRSHFRRWSARPSGSRRAGRAFRTPPASWPAGSF